MSQKSDETHPVIRNLIDREFPDRSNAATAKRAGYVAGAAQTHFIYRLAQFNEPQEENVQALCAEIAFWWGMNYTAEQLAGMPQREMPTAITKLS